MLNNEEILVKLMQLLDIDMKDIKLKQSSEKKRFITQEESYIKYSDHMTLILKKLNIDKQNNELIKIFTDLLFLYNNLYVKLFPLSSKYTDKKLNWIILKRLVVPFLALRFANLDCDYGSRIDKNLSGGRFWYLPDVTQYNKLKLPMEYLMNWWLDLYGKNIDSLCTELDEKNNNDNKAIESKNTIKQWFQKSIPDRKSIEKYCSIQLEYKGVFIVNINDNIEDKFLSAIEFVRNKKKISVENLKHEIPYNSLVDEIFIENKSISNEEKDNFVTFIKERWQKPSSDKLIKSFFIGRSIQDLYKRVIKYFNFKDSSDIEDNKIVQIIHHYQLLYNEQIKRNVYNKKDDTFSYEYEYLDLFSSSLDDLLKTLYGDITIECENPNFEYTKLEDIYQVKFILFGQNQDERLEKSIIEMKNHAEYFHKEYDDIDEKLKIYKKMPKNEKLIKISTEKNFQCLVNLFNEYFSDIDYSISEKCVLQMSKISNTQDEKQISMSTYLTLYTNLVMTNNCDKYTESKHLCDIYKQMLDKSERYEMKENEYLMAKASFHFKAKEFDTSLIYWDEYYNKYIKNQKKLDETIYLIKLSAYCAYITNNKKLLKEYNNYLIKIGLPEFNNLKSLEIPIYFYN